MRNENKKQKYYGKIYNIEKYGLGNLPPHPILKHVSKVMMRSIYFP